MNGGTGGGAAAAAAVATAAAGLGERGAAADQSTEVCGVLCYRLLSVS